MDESTIRALLDRATESEPPIGPVARNALRAGRQLRRRRRMAGTAALSGVAVVLAGGLPALTGAIRPPAPPAHQGTGETAYVVVAGSPSDPGHPSLSSVVPVGVGTNKPGRPIGVAGGTYYVLGATTAVTAPDQKSVYVLNQDSVSRVSTATNTAGKPVSISQSVDPLDIGITPNGKTVYAAGSGGLVPIRTATNTALRPIRAGDALNIAITPDGETLYVVHHLGTRPATVTPILTATNTAGRPIRLRLPATSPGSPDSIAITPDGATAYVVDSVQEENVNSSYVSPVSTSTNVAGKPIKLTAPGFADGIVITADGRTGYVLSSREVTPINIATNTAGPAISLPASAGAGKVLTITPDGKTVYVLTPRAVVPVSTATNTAAAPIAIRGGVGPGYVIAVSPDGRTAYVGGAAGLIPISTVTDTAGPPIRLPGTAARGTVIGIAFAR